jgi:hypothetical protein
MESISEGISMWGAGDILYRPDGEEGMKYDSREDIIMGGSDIRDGASSIPLISICFYVCTNLFLGIKVQP